MINYPIPQAAQHTLANALRHWSAIVMWRTTFPCASPTEPITATPREEVDYLMSQHHTLPIGCPSCGAGPNNVCYPDGAFGPSMTCIEIRPRHLVRLLKVVDAGSPPHNAALVHLQHNVLLAANARLSSWNDKRWKMVRCPSCRAVPGLDCTLLGTTIAGHPRPHAHMSRQHAATLLARDIEMCLLMGDPA